jgi:hypothetical protein
MVSIIVLAFSIVLYVVDDPLEIDSLSTAIYMCRWSWFLADSCCIFLTLAAAG